MQTEFKLFIGETVTTKKGRVIRLAAQDIADSIDLHVGEHFSGYTVLKGRGVWGGMVEPCTVVIVLSEAQKIGFIRDAARSIRQDLEQEAVILTATQVHVEEL